MEHAAFQRNDGHVALDAETRQTTVPTSTGIREFAFPLESTTRV